MGRTALAVLAAVSLMASCGSDDERTDRVDEEEEGSEANQAAPTDEGAPVDGGVLRVALPGEIDGLNPATNRWTIDGNMIGSAIFDTLMRFDEDRNLVPNLAESVTPNDEGTEWTIVLPEGITFHDGTPLDAEAVALNIQLRVDNPLTGGALEPVETVEPQDDGLTVLVTMNTPWFGYSSTLAAEGGYIAAPSQLNDAESTRIAIGTGPFRFDGRFSPGQAIEVERNEEYWGERAHLDGIEFTAVVDPLSRKEALVAATVDMIVTDHPQTVEELRTQDGVIQVEDNRSEEGYIMLNHGVEPFDDPAAREILALGTDLENLISALGPDVWSPASGPYSGDDAYTAEDDNYPAYDPDAAAAALEAYEAENGPLAFTIKTSVGAQAEIAQALQGQWSDLGIDVEVEQLEQSTFIGDAFLGNFQAASFRNFGYINPDSNYIFWHSSQAKGIGTGSINFGQMHNDELDALLDEARAEPDDAARTELYKQLTPVLNEALPYIWLFHADFALAARDDVGGLSIPQELGFSRQDTKPWWNLLWLKR